MPANRDWPERAWWSVLLLQVVAIFILLLVLRQFGLVAAIAFGLVVVIFEVWWQIGPFWTKEQRVQIKRRSMARINEHEE